MSAMHYKDAILDGLAERANVAQFVSFGTNLEQHFARIYGYDANHRFESLEGAITALLTESVERSVNVRSYDPASPKKHPFEYGIKRAEEAAGHVRRMAAQGLHTIVNETIDVDDGGVSGVALGDLLEFAPGDTPRAVEKPGTAALPRALGLRLLETVYGFRPALDYAPTTRVEFSVHPLRRGVRRDHTIVWELEEVGPSHAQADLRWPNRFSRHIGDKAFGLLIAHLLALPVPETTCVARRVAPFRYGRPTGAAEVWIRTAPAVQVPGKFTTRRGWVDPFHLMAEEDPSGESIASVLAQAGVSAVFSGALIATENGELTIEGTRGYGDAFMVGTTGHTPLPGKLLDLLRALYDEAAAHLGPVRFEWVYDGQQVWIVQFHRGASVSHGRTIYPGEAASYRRLHVNEGLESLRQLVGEVTDTGEGIVLIGDVGITSHFGDVLRKAQVPSRIEPEAATAY